MEKKIPAARGRQQYRRCFSFRFFMILAIIMTAALAGWMPSAAAEPAGTGAEGPYLIRVNRTFNCVTVYSADKDGGYNIPVRAMICSVGKAPHYTIPGNFTVSNRYQWRLMLGDVYGRYAVRFYDQLLFHSVCFYSQNESTLMTDEYNKLGEPASKGCVRLAAVDAKWIYDHCPAGTPVRVFSDSSSPGYMGKPQAVRIPSSSACKGWDPTDPSAANPWKALYVRAAAKPVPAYVNGKAAQTMVCEIKDTYYIRLSDLAKLVNGTEKQFDVSRQPAGLTVQVRSKAPYTSVNFDLGWGDGKERTAIPSVSNIRLDGKAVGWTVYNLEGVDYYKLRDVAGTMGIGLSWNPDDQGVIISTR